MDENVMASVIVVRGGGDLASGVIHRLHRCGYRVLILESEKPSAIRRMVSFCEAVYDGEAFVEGVLSHRVESLEECAAVWRAGEIPLLVDPECDCLRKLHAAAKGEQCEAATGELRPAVKSEPHPVGTSELCLAALVDAILAKRNLGTTRCMAPLTIALGPGFEAGEDVDYVVETMRGHNLGRIIEEGSALPNTGVPGMVGGISRERVIHSPAAGTIRNEAKIADLVEEGDVIAYVGEAPVAATITGVLRGIIRDGYQVKKGMKIADIDPRTEERQNCYSISDKARCIAGSVVEILLSQGVLPVRADR